MSNVKVNEMSAGYTRTTVAVLGKSSELAIQTRSLDGICVPLLRK